MDIKGLMDKIKKSNLLGNNQRYGKEFDDIESLSAKGLPFPRLIIIRKGVIIDNLTFVYSESTSSHGGNGGTKQETGLMHDEHIIKVAGTYAQFSGQSIIETLSFTTDKGRTINAGMPRKGANYFEFQAKEGHAIFGMFGRADHYLGNIGFYTREINMEIGKGMPKMPNTSGFKL